MMRRISFSISLTLAATLAGLIPGCACDESGSGRSEGPAKIEIQPAKVELSAGETAVLVLRALDAGGSTYRKPLAIEWSSQDDEVAVVVDGRVTGIAPGETTIVSKVGRLRATAAVEVRGIPLASLRIEPDEATIRVGEEQTFSVLAFDASGKRIEGLAIEWRVSGEGTVSLEVEGKEARAEGRRKGIVQVTATAGGLEANAKLTVLSAPAAIEVEVPSFLLLGEVVHLEARVVDEDGEEIDEEVVWTTSTPERVALLPTGRLEAVAEGIAAIRARAGTLARDFEVAIESRRVERLSVDFPPQITLGESHQLVAKAFDQRDEPIAAARLEWSSSHPDILSITPDGLLRAEARGEATIVARVGEVEDAGHVRVFVPVGKVEVEGPGGELLLGESHTFVARVYGTDGPELYDRAVHWSATPDDRLAIDETTGEAQARLPGTVVVRALAEGVFGEVAVETVELSFTEIHAGTKFVCGLTTAGEVFCVGQVPDGTPTPPTFDRPTLIPSPVALAGLALGTTHGCGLDADGAPHCFGTNAYGESGRQDRTGSSAFLPVETGLRFTRLYAGTSMTCGITSAATGDNTYCWGANFHGQLGDGTTEDRSSPTPILGHRFAHLALSMVTSDEGATSCGIDESGLAFCWGKNDAGQMGTGDTLPSLTPIWAGPSETLQSLSIASESAPPPQGTLGHGCAVNAAAQLMCWGANAFGELGDGSQTSRLLPEIIPGEWRMVRTVRSYGRGTTCALESAGTVSCWGSNGAELIGSADMGISIPTPTPIPGGLRFQSFVLGPGIGCGMALHGKAYCWGQGWSDPPATPRRILGQRP